MFDWTHYLGLARTLAGQPEEAAKRSAISRAYYAVFNKARAMLEREGQAIPATGKAHEDVWNTLINAGKGRRRLGNDGKRLRDLRRKADYEDSVMAIDKVVQDALATAETLNRLVDSESAAKTPGGGPTAPPRV